jgi:hypothetical protein
MSSGLIYLGHVAFIRKQQLQNILVGAIGPGVFIDTTWIIYRDEVKDYLLSRQNQACRAGQS